MSTSLDRSQVKKITLRVLIAIVVIALSFLSYYMFGNYSKGTRVGNVIKISKKGVMFKTWEGQLNLGAIVNGADGVSDTTWEFSVPKSKKQVLKDIDTAIIDGKRVKLYYKQKYILLPWRGDTDYLVYKVDILEN